MIRRVLVLAAAAGTAVTLTVPVAVPANAEENAARGWSVEIGCTDGNVWDKAKIWYKSAAPDVDAMYIRHYLQLKKSATTYAGIGAIYASPQWPSPEVNIPETDAQIWQGLAPGTYRVVAAFWWHYRDNKGGHWNKHFRPSNDCRM